MDGWDRYDERVTAVVRRHGWFVQYVLGDTCASPECGCAKTGQPAYAYSIGLHGLGHPELLIFGVPPETAGGVINVLGRRVRAGEILIPGELVTFDEWTHRVRPEVVPDAEGIVLGANRYYRRPPGRSVPVLQLSYDDRAGLFPWEPGHAAPSLQPRPGTFPPPSS
ncbi:DUF4262 domain-containing protein [Luedemannella helvata]|uniref:DUF4262 domain-containing protein n=1 Tax=Luedemannella helvata TaxID=349315 RepID=A0ABN2KAX9_9ACTN